MDISSATYLISKIDGSVAGIQLVYSSGEEWSVPLDPANRHYAAIMQAVADGQLTIQEASE